MIDNLVLLSIHALIGLAGWRLMLRDDLDADPAIAADGPAAGLRQREESGDDAAGDSTPSADLPSVPKLQRLKVARD